ncbi:hypothetical protein RFI_22284 [Reticulomyxa filosa]|uniref:Uncharacterized protein n=1 Tax=Reticulomyxa filosa TaxID=46433 RepID=X6MMJ6_RETFI|nr:hypothetical protein RFI_22284 [Reticulomyxa filosa]|eukprot:ETO15079.1 hypothetical protein RFI_22284 [Reticulomyxa filosa]
MTTFIPLAKNIFLVCKKKRSLSHFLNRHEEEIFFLCIKQKSKRFLSTLVTSVFLGGQTSLDEEIFNSKAIFSSSRVAFQLNSNERYVAKDCGWAIACISVRTIVSFCLLLLYWMCAISAFALNVIVSESNNNFQDNYSIIFQRERLSLVVITLFTFGLGSSFIHLNEKNMAYYYKKKKKVFIIFAANVSLAFKGTVFNYEKSTYQATAMIIVIKGLITIVMCIWLVIRASVKSSNIRHGSTKKGIVALLLWSLVGLFVSIFLTILFVRKLYELVKTELETMTSPTTMNNIEYNNNLSPTSAAMSRSFSFSLDQPQPPKNNSIKFHTRQQILIKTITKYCLLNGIAACVTWMWSFIFVLKLGYRIGHINALLNLLTLFCVIISTCLYLQFSCTQSTYIRICHCCHICCFRGVKRWMKAKLHNQHPPTINPHSIVYITSPPIDLRSNPLEIQNENTNQ